MNVLILGCSFGVPGMGCTVEAHTETQLRVHGHTVYNFSIPGGSNVASLALAKDFIQTHPIDIDWIVWFHTELIRDCSDLSQDLRGQTLDLSQHAEVVYSRYLDFQKKLNAKIAVVGGAGPVHPVLYDYITPDFCIPYWFSKILNLDLPAVQTLSRLDIVEKIQGIGLASKLELLQQHETILDALEASEDFGDNYHAGPGPHIELAKELNQVFLLKK